MVTKASCRAASVMYFCEQAFLIFQMGNTGPCGILAAGFIMQPSFIFTAAFPAIDPAGKAVPVLVSPGIMTIPFFPSTLFQNRIGTFKLFPADDCLMVVLHEILVNFSPVLMAVKACYLYRSSGTGHPRYISHSQ